MSLSPATTTGQKLALTRSLASNKCPACSMKKKNRQTLCTFCYSKLPRALAHRLYDRLGAGYEVAVSNAFAHLNRPAFWLDAKEPGEQPPTAFPRQE